MARELRWTRWLGVSPTSPGNKDSWSQNLTGFGYEEGVTILRTRGRLRMWCPNGAANAENVQQFIAGVFGYMLIYADGTINPTPLWLLQDWQINYPSLFDNILWQASSDMQLAPLPGGSTIDHIGYTIADSAQLVDSKARRTSRPINPDILPSMWLLTYTQKDFWVTEGAGPFHRFAWQGEQLTMQPDVP